MMLGQLQRAHHTLRGHFTPGPAYLGGSDKLRAYLFFIYGLYTNTLYQIERQTYYEKCIYLPSHSPLYFSLIKSIYIYDKTWLKCTLGSLCCGKKIHSYSIYMYSKTIFIGVCLILHGGYHLALKIIES